VWQVHSPFMIDWSTLGLGGGAYRSWGMLGPFIHQMSTICMHVHVHMVLCIDASSVVLVYID
jgi:hypothetical protein